MWPTAGGGVSVDLGLNALGSRVCVCFNMDVRHATSPSAIELYMAADNIGYIHMYPRGGGNFS